MNALSLFRRLVWPLCEKYAHSYMKSTCNTIQKHSNVMSRFWNAYYSNYSLRSKVSANNKYYVFVFPMVRSKKWKEINCTPTTHTSKKNVIKRKKQTIVYEVCFHTLWWTLLISSPFSFSSFILPMDRHRVTHGFMPEYVYF